MKKTKLINDNGILYLQYTCNKCNNESIIKFRGAKTYSCFYCNSKFKVIVSKIIFNKR